MGLEFARQFAARGDRVFATCRSPETAVRLQPLAEQFAGRLTIVPLDVSDAESIARSFEVVSAETDVLDVLVNNAGIGSIPGSSPQVIGQMKMDDALGVLRSNAVGPLIIAQQYLELLRKSARPRVANVSSGWGSVSHADAHWPYYYCASKACLHMYMRILAGDCREWGLIPILLDPGQVRTDMGGPDQPLSPEESVAGMIRVIDAATLEQSGHFLGWRGDERPL